jgi:hypothetical protein
MKPFRISRYSRVRYGIKNTLKRKRATVVGVFSHGIFNDAGSAFNLFNSTFFSATGGEGILPREWRSADRRIKHYL